MEQVEVCMNVGCTMLTCRHHLADHQARVFRLSLPLYWLLALQLFAHFAIQLAIGVGHRDVRILNGSKFGSVQMRVGFTPAPRSS